MTPRLHAILLAPIAALFLLSSQPATAADYTDLLDAVDDFDDYKEDTFKAFDIALEPSFVMSFGSAKVSRDGLCGDKAALKKDIILGDSGWISQDECSNTTVKPLKQLAYRSSQYTLNIDLRVGLFKDLEFRARVPYVISQSTGVKLDPEMEPGSKSTISPRKKIISDQLGLLFPGRKPTASAPDIKELRNRFRANKLFDVTDEYQDYKRSGFANPTIGLHYGIFNDHRDDTLPTFNIGFDYTIPAATIKKIDNTAVGDGRHQFDLSFKTSKQFSWIEPYFGLNLIGRVYAADSPIRASKVPGNQGLPTAASLPPLSGKMTLGAEIIAYEDPATYQRYSVDLRFAYTYTSRGRDYSPLFDQFKNSGCNGKTLDDIVKNPECSWLLHQPSNSTGRAWTPGDIVANKEAIYTYNGATFIDSYSTFAGSIAVNIQPWRYLSFQAFGALEGQTNHYLGGTPPGKPLKDKTGPKAKPGKVQLDEPEYAEKERSPIYNQELDSYDRRLRFDKYLQWQIGFKLALMY